MFEGLKCVRKVGRGDVVSAARGQNVVDDRRKVLWRAVLLFGGLGAIRASVKSLKAASLFAKSRRMIRVVSLSMYFLKKRLLPGATMSPMNAVASR